MIGTADSALIREVSFIQGALYREVPLYTYSVYTITESVTRSGAVGGWVA